MELIHPNTRAERGQCSFHASKDADVDPGIEEERRSDQDGTDRP